MINKIINIGSLLISVLAIAVALYVYTIKNSLAYVDVSKVYTEFKLSKELQKKYAKSAMVRNTVLDSLRFSINVITKQIENSNNNAERMQLQQKYNQKVSEYQVKESELIEDNEQQNQTYKTQIQTQLNQYIKDFGEENNYDLIFGADGSGTMLYATDSKDITSEVIEFANKKYTGL